MMRRLVVLGGTGFVRRALLQRLCPDSAVRVSLLLHSARPKWLDGLDVEIIVGKAEDRAVLHRLLEHGGTVINLIRPAEDGLYPMRVEGLLKCSITRGVFRFIQCST